MKIILEDDLEGGPADETIQFSLDGRQYEIDLSTANAKKLRDSLSPYVSAGRRPQIKQPRATSPKATSAGDPDTAKIRAWARENGIEVSDRGRIHKSTREAFYAANQ